VPESRVPGDGAGHPDLDVVGMRPEREQIDGIDLRRFGADRLVATHRH
jgi:hypothetical protein